MLDGCYKGWFWQLCRYSSNSSGRGGYNAALGIEWKIKAL